MTRLRPFNSCLAALALAASGLAAPPETRPAETPAEAPPQTPPETPAEAPAKAEKTPLVVTLVEPGAGPRRPFRFRPKVGSTEVIEMTIRVDMEQTMDGMAMPSQKTPAMQYTMQVTITDVDAAGDVSYDFEYQKADIIDEPGVNPFLSEMMRNALKAIEGLHGKGVITDQGYNKMVRFDRDPDTDPTLLQQMEGMEQSMEQLVSPFPDEPIGVGAVWKVEGALEQQGMQIHQGTTIHLVAAEGDRVEVEADLHQDAEPQKFEAPGMPPMSLKSYKADGQVKSVLMLNHLFPTSSTTKLTNETTVVIESPGAQQELTQRTVLDSELKAK
jgi:hypothetical protein